MTFCTLGWYTLSCPRLYPYQPPITRNLVHTKIQLIFSTAVAVVTFLCSPLFQLSMGMGKDFTSVLVKEGLKKSVEFSSQGQFSTLFKSIFFLLFWLDLGLWV